MKPIYVFYRTRHTSNADKYPGRERPEWFSKEKCFGEVVNWEGVLNDL
jgi:hypothetical protein